MLLSPAVVPQRLRSGRDIAAVRRDGRRRAGRLLVVHATRTDDPSPARLAVVASRSVGGAVGRNRAKRLLREASRHVEWRSGQDVVLVARAGIVEAKMHEVLDELVTLADALDAAA